MAASALTLAGSAFDGGGGTHGDLMTFRGLVVHGARAITALAAQTPRAETAAEAASPATNADQMAAAFDDLAERAMALGMLCEPEAIAAVAERLRGEAGLMGHDPVMVAKFGDQLLTAEAQEPLRDTPADGPGSGTGHRPVHHSHGVWGDG